MQVFIEFIMVFICCDTTPMGFNNQIIQFLQKVCQFTRNRILLVDSDSQNVG